jgi:2-(3-amino-3-carboxypropyl)histidine synthase
VSSFSAFVAAQLIAPLRAVPVDTTTIKTLYVFVEISVDRAHLAASVRLNFPHCIPSPTGTRSSSKGKGPELEITIEEPTKPTPSPAAAAPEKPTKLAVVGTIQFGGGLAAREAGD